MGGCSLNLHLVHILANLRLLLSLLLGLLGVAGGILRGLTSFLSLRLGLLGCLGGVQIQILLILNDLVQGLAHLFQGGFLITGCLQFSDLLIDLLKRAFQGVDGGLLRIGGILAIVQTFLGLVHLACGLSQSIRGLGGKIVRGALGVLRFSLHFALLFTLATQLVSLVRARFALLA